MERRKRKLTEIKQAIADRGISQTEICQHFHYGKNWLYYNLVKGRQSFPKYTLDDDLCDYLESLGIDTEGVRLSVEVSVY